MAKRKRTPNKRSRTVNNYIRIPSTLQAFENTGTRETLSSRGRRTFIIEGRITSPGTEYCLECGCRLHVHGSREQNLRHIAIGRALSEVRFSTTRYYCPSCGKTRNQLVPFKAAGHQITKELLSYTRGLLAYGLTLKAVSEITGLGKNVVKAIDEERLKERYTVDGKTFIMPERQTRFLGIDEFKLHNGHKYATVIIDMETGHILWLARGKKKECVFSFIRHVGEEWMGGVEAVCCDMNSDFQEAFEEKCQHIQVVFDYFHIKKNLNEKVIGEIRKDEQRRLIAEGDKEGARLLKGSKYILMSSRETLMRKDSEDKAAGEAGATPGKPDEEKKTRLDIYDDILSRNRLLFTADLIKEMLSGAYRQTDEVRMAEMIAEIMRICHETGNRHFLWFERLLDRHFEGIIAHATYGISTGKLEGINNKTKTVRRQGYGYPDDDYFFLKLFDASRRERFSSL